MTTAAVPQHSSAAPEGPPVVYGCTKPLSLRLPSSRDRALTESLETMMHEKNLYETPEGMAHREQVLRKLERILEEWARDVTLQTGGQTTDVAQARLFTFGSYKLGVVAPGGDIDALVVTANTVSRESFFTSLVTALRAQPLATKVQAVPDAFTPIIKLCFDGIDVDLLFARLAIPRLPANLNSLSDDSLLRNVDEKTVRSLNGSRVAADLVNLVPDKNNFVTALRFIKYWASRRGVYSNAFGYLGGISWALLVGRACQLYPYAAPAKLVLKFFAIFSEWDWSRAVQLCPIKEYSGEAGLMYFHVWNPKVNAHDRFQNMAVITPSFPCMNSTYNVTQTTLNVLKGEFSRGHKMCNMVRKGEATWEDVVTPLDFFASSEDFLEIRIHAANATIFSKLKGYIESRVRILIKKLESLETVSLHLWPETICWISHPEGSEECDGAIYLALSPLGVEELDFEPVIPEFVVTTFTQWTDWQSYYNAVNLRISHVTRSNLPEHVEAYRRRLGLTIPLNASGT